jgi:hypothetical protein
MKRNLAIFVTMLGILGAPALAQSALDKYMKMNTQGAGTSEAKNDPSVIYKGPEGFWRLDDTRSAGGFCAVTYYAASYFAGYVGPVVGNPDSFILFSGPTIPPIQTEKKKKMKLTTGDGTAQSVLAFHAPNRQSKESGIILFRLTDIQAAISEMSDVEDMYVVMDKKQIFAIKWKGGFKAQKAMQNCIGSSAKQGGVK